MHYLSHRDLGDESHIRGTDWATVRDAAGRIAAIYPCSSGDYTCTSDRYTAEYYYPHGDGTDERQDLKAE